MKSLVKSMVVLFLLASLAGCASFKMLPPLESQEFSDTDAILLIGGGVAITKIDDTLLIKNMVTQWYAGFAEYAVARIQQGPHTLIGMYTKTSGNSVMRASDLYVSFDFEPGKIYRVKPVFSGFNRIHLEIVESTDEDLNTKVRASLAEEASRS